MRTLAIVVLAIWLVGWAGPLQATNAPIGQATQIAFPTSIDTDSDGIDDEADADDDGDNVADSIDAFPLVMKVRIQLAALTRVEYSKEIDVPDDLTDADLDTVVQDAYIVEIAACNKDEIDGGDYWEDPHYWEQGQCYWEKV